MDCEGRMITLELEDYYFNLVYTPNSGDGLKRLKERQEWDRLYADYLMKLDEKKPVIRAVSISQIILTRMTGFPFLEV